MVSYGLNQAKRKLAPVDSPYDWDRDRPVPPHVDNVPDRDDDVDDDALLEEKE